MMKYEYVEYNIVFTWIHQAGSTNINIYYISVGWMEKRLCDLSCTVFVWRSSYIFSSVSSQPIYEWIIHWLLSFWFDFLPNETKTIMKTEIDIYSKQKIVYGFIFWSKRVNSHVTCLNGDPNMFCSKADISNRSRY